MHPKTIGTCRGDGCSTKLVAKRIWSRYSQEERRTLADEGYGRHEGHEFCPRHYVRDRSEHPDRQPGPLTPAQLERRNLVFELWEKYKTFPDPVGEIAFELGDRDRATVKGYLKRAFGIEPPAVDLRTLERDYQVGELKFLHSAGVGIAVVAEKLGYDVLELVKRTVYWHRREGLIDFDYADYLTPEEADEILDRRARRESNARPRTRPSRANAPGTTGLGRRAFVKNSIVASNVNAGWPGQ